MSKRRMRCSVSLDEIMDRALNNIAEREERTRSAVAYMLLKESPRMSDEMDAIYKSIYGTERRCWCMIKIKNVRDAWTSLEVPGSDINEFIEFLMKYHKNSNKIKGGVNYEFAAKNKNNKHKNKKV